MQIPSFSEARIARFWLRVDTSGGPDACWPWTGAKTKPRKLKNGTIHQYGYIALKNENGARVTHGAHRIAFFLATGQDPGNLNVCHECDFGLCCNPAHLFSGTQAENVADMMQKGRHVSLRGADSSRATLTQTQVEEIRAALVTPGSRLAELGQRFGVSHSTLHRISRGSAVRHQTWFGQFAPLDRTKVRASGRNHPTVKNRPTTDFEEVKRLYARGTSQQRIADQLGLAQSIVSQIVRGTHWSQRGTRHAP